MSERIVTIKGKWESIGYSGTTERLVLIHKPIFKGDVQAEVTQCYGPDSIFFRATIPMTNRKTPIEADFATKEEAQLWTEEQLQAKVLT